ncbi:MAG TPA: hemolysin III family protein [Xanthomonadaceae bacterium]|nr:hemolysin III family protein [Xanthomonadaceae bacterium]
MVHAPRVHSQREEIANALTHGIGAVAAIAGGSVLITLAALSGDVRRVVGASVFVAGLVLLYTASTLYHAIPHPHIKSRLRVFDHCAIFVLIAGTYTPFTLVALHGGWGWSLLATIWTLAVLGIVLKLFVTGRFQRLSTLIYVAMGWLVVIAAGPLVDSLPFWSLFWLVAGGLSYTAGTFFYHARRPRYAHAVFHGFVLGGSTMHFVAVSLQLL